MSNSAWCDLKKKCTNQKLHDLCHNPKSICQKQISFTPKHFQLQGSGLKNTMEKVFKVYQTVWNKILKPSVNVAATFIGMAVSAKLKNLTVDQATTNIFKSISGGKI